MYLNYLKKYSKLTHPDAVENSFTENKLKHGEKESYSIIFAFIYDVKIHLFKLSSISITKTNYKNIFI